MFDIGKWRLMRRAVALLAGESGDPAKIYERTPLSLMVATRVFSKFRADSDDLQTGRSGMKLTW